MQTEETSRREFNSALALGFQLFEAFRMSGLARTPVCSGAQQKKLVQGSDGD